MPRTSTILALAALLLVTVLYAAWTPRQGLGQLGRDGPRYMMMAEHYSLRHRADTVVTEMAVSSYLPPLYPLLLSWSGGSDDLARAHLATTACLLLGLLAYCAWMWQAGASVAQAALMALLFATLPSTWDTALLIQSEFLYLLLSLAALALLAAHGREPRRDLLLAAAATISAAIMCRTVGACLLPALLLAAWRSPWRLRLVASFIALLPALTWKLLHHDEHSYGGVLSAIYGSSPWQALLQQLGTELPALRRGLEANFAIGQRLWWLGDALGLLCLASLLWRALRLRPDAVYLAAGCLVVLLWPYPEEAQRLLWVLLPPALLQPVLLLAELRREPAAAAGPALLNAAIAALLLALLLPSLELRAGRYWDAPFSGAPGARGMISWYGADPLYSHHAVLAENAFSGAIRRIGDEVPENECVLTTRPDLVDYYAHRRGVRPPLRSVPDPLFATLVRLSGCNYVFGMSYKDSIYPVTLYPLQRLEGKLWMRDVTYLPDDEGGQPELIAALAQLASARDVDPVRR